MNEHCKSERSYASASRIYSNLLVTLTNVWSRDHHSVNKEEWDSERENQFLLRRAFLADSFFSRFP